MLAIAAAEVEELATDAMPPVTPSEGCPAAALSNAILVASFVCSVVISEASSLLCACLINKDWTVWLLVRNLSSEDEDVKLLIQIPSQVSLSTYGQDYA